MDLFFGKKRGERPNRLPLKGDVQIEKDGLQRAVSIEEFEALTQVLFIPPLDFDDFSLFLKIQKQVQKLLIKKEIPPEQLWLGSYYRSEILKPSIPDIIFRWVDPVIGWGVFAGRDFKKREYISEYGGKLRKKSRLDAKNAYCFEYIAAPGIYTSYTIDAREQGGVGRFINHSYQPNLLSTLATVDGMNHVIFIVKEPIAKGMQLLYDYGADYWKSRTGPLNL